MKIFLRTLVAACVTLALPTIQGAADNEFNNLAGKPEAAGVERELKAALQEWMIMERDYLPLPVPPQ